MPRLPSPGRTNDCLKVRVTRLPFQLPAQLLRTANQNRRITRPAWVKFLRGLTCSANFRPEALLELSVGVSRYFPEPSKTAPAVFNKILKSSQSDQFWMYSRSSFTHSSKSFISFRPLTCQRHVMPGFTASFCL